MGYDIHRNHMIYGGFFVYPSDLTDEQWVVIEAALASARDDARRYAGGGRRHPVRGQGRLPVAKSAQAVWAVDERVFALSPHAQPRRVGSAPVTHISGNTFTADVAHE